LNITCLSKWQKRERFFKSSYEESRLFGEPSLCYSFKNSSKRSLTTRQFLFASWYFQGWILKIWEDREFLVVKSILVVDADNESRKLLCRFLQILGHEEIREAKDGLEAMEQLVQKSPDFVLFDMQTPKIDGFLLSEIVSHVKRFHGIPVVLMGAVLDSSIIEKGMQAGAYAFLEKPLTPEGIKKVLSGIPKPTISPLKMSKSAQVVIPEIATAAKGMLTLIFGQQGKIIKIEEFTNEMKKKHWEVSGIIRAKGGVAMEIALGISLEMAKSLAAWLGKKDLSPISVGQAEGEFLTSILKRALKPIGVAYALKPETAQVSFNSPLPINPQATEAYVIQLRVAMQRSILQKQLTIFLVVTLTMR
jgi:two-component system, chemotaxis family, chemotaxis protein CheY